MARITLSDRFIASEKRRPASGRIDYFDAIVPGLALRVTSTGHRSFVLIARYPMNPRNPTRRALGNCYIPPKDHDAGRFASIEMIQDGALTLGEAREKARTWLALIQKGIDPKVEDARRRATELRRQVNTFGTVAAQFLERHAVGLAKAEEAKRIVNAEFVKRWRDRPVTDILPEEAAAAIRDIVKRGAPYQAHNALGYLRRLFNWAIGTHEFGITASPIERLSPKDLIGKREPRERVLLDPELAAIWSAAGGPTDVVGARRGPQA